MRNKFLIPYADKELPVLLPQEQVDFACALPETEKNVHWKEELVQKLDQPTGGPALRSFLRPGQHIVILTEDNTRHTPVKEMLPILCDYLTQHGAALNNIEILIAPGTHRVMIEAELLEKLGEFAMKNLKISQHDYRDLDALVHLDDVEIGEMKIPVEVNRIAVEADLLIGLGNIIPHPNAGYSGGAKILDPGCCGKGTVSATHVAAALMGYLPLGMAENDCRCSLELVAKRVGLKFIINVILDADNQVVDIVTGDFIQAHRVGTEISRSAFSVPIKALVDILISCSYPYDIDFWQCEKAMISGYFAVKKGGIMIVLAPCLEGVAHNHEDLIDWLALSREYAMQKLRDLWVSGADGDLVAASIAIGALTVSEKAKIFIYTDGLTNEEVERMGYRAFSCLQSAVDAALAEIPNGRIGILMRGGDCLPTIQQD